MQLSVKPKADLSHNPFDTASRDVFSLKTGMITPCLVRHTLPDSMYDCKLTSLTRTIPVQSAPFTRMSQNFEYYFVPYSQIFQDFERIYYERGDEQKNITGSVVGAPTHATQLPCFSIKVVLGYLWRNFCVERIKLDLRLMSDTAARHAAKLSLLVSARKNIYPDELQDIHGRTCAEDQLRIFDMLGYGNYLSMFKIIYDKSYMYYKNLWSSQSSSLPQHWSVFFDALDGDFASFAGIQDIESCLDDLHSSTFWEQFYNNLSDQYPNVFALAAYVKVWSDFYRNSTYDINLNYAQLFNFDYIVDDSQIVVGGLTIAKMLVPRYRQYKKDMFTGGYPSAQFGSVAVANLENPTSIYNTASSPAITSTVGVSANAGSNGLRPVGLTNNISGSYNTWIIDSSVSALSVRQALSMQRYKERILRAGNRTRSLQSAIFGDKSRYIEDLYVDFLGSEQSVIDFNSVAATSSNDRNELGELGSNGVSSLNNHVFKYHSHDFGIILGVTYILPESEYEAYMIDYFNTASESYDFYKPDFMNIGLQEVYNFHFNNIPSPDNNQPYTPLVLNYLSRYWPYKVAVDKVHGEFYSSLPFDNTSYEESFSYSGTPLSVGAFAEFVTPRKSNSLLYLVLPSLYVNPSDVDRIFYQISDETQASDQFKCVTYHDFKSVLPMSVVGLPSL